MPRPYSMPSPDSRSPSEPTCVLSNEQVLGIYNRGKKANEKALYVTKNVQEAILELAKNQNWDKAWFSGNQCILENITVAKCKKNN